MDGKKTPRKLMQRKSTPVRWGSNQPVQPSQSQDNEEPDDEVLEEDKMVNIDALKQKRRESSPVGGRQREFRRSSSASDMSEMEEEQEGIYGKIHKQTIDLGGSGNCCCCCDFDEYSDTTIQSGANLVRGNCCMKMFPKHLGPSEPDEDTTRDIENDDWSARDGKPKAGRKGDQSSSKEKSSRRIQSTMRTAIICFLVFVVMPSIVNGEPKALKPPCEFVLLIDGSKSIIQGEGGKGNFQKMVDIINKWPDHFQISEEASRVAVVQFGGNASLELQLTGNESSVRGLTFKHQAQTTNTHLGLEMIKNEVFNLAREDALKIVIIITDGASTEKELASKAAENLREAEAVTYALFIGDEYNTVQDTKNHVDNGLAGDPERVFNINDFAKLTEKFIQDLRNHIECDFEEVCQFDNGTTCHNAWVRRMIAYSNHTCTNVPSKTRPFKKTCNTDVCDKECDKWWKWVDNCDDTNVGKTIKVNREGPKPARQSLDNCPIDKEVTCPKPTQPDTASSTEDPAAKGELEDGSDSGGGGDNGGNGKWNDSWGGILIGCLILCLIIIVICASSGLCGTGQPQGDNPPQGGGQLKTKGKVGVYKVAQEDDDYGSASMKTLNDYKR